jgi:hypothetical protein
MTRKRRKNFVLSFSDNCGVVREGLWRSCLKIDRYFNNAEKIRQDQKKCVDTFAS